jgi:hypothetical protein
MRYVEWQLHPVAAALPYLIGICHTSLPASEICGHKKTLTDFSMRDVMGI